MELLLNSNKLSATTALAAHYFDLIKTNKLTVLYPTTTNPDDVRFPRLTDVSGEKTMTLTEPIVIIQYMVSKLRRDISEALYSSKDLLQRAKIDEWLSFVAEKHFECSDPSSLHILNSHLATETFFCAKHITIVDLIIFAIMHHWMSHSTIKERLSNCHLTRWFDHIQHLPGIFNVKETNLPFVIIGETNKNIKNVLSNEAKKIIKNEPIQQKTTRHTELSTSENGKTMSATKPPKQDKTKISSNPSGIIERPINDPTRLDIKVGCVLKAWNHPDAERLYCEEVDIGEPAPRKIASGLREFISLNNFEGEKVLVLANMKEKKLRGFPSHGMLLCGKSTNAEGQEIVELVKPPKDAIIGERILFEDCSGNPDTVLNTKTGKDPFVAVQPDFQISNEGYASYKNFKFVTSKGFCKCDTLRQGIIS